jgi:bacteriocin biosynthesis cyclodehydratase domain-containing protein
VGADGAAPCTELLAATSGLTIADVQERLSASEVHVLGSGPRAASIRRLLGTPRTLGWADPPPRTGFVIVAPSGDEVHRVADWNAHTIAAPVEWMQVLPYDGRLAAIGPVFVPGETACHECFLVRRDFTIAPSRDRTRGRFLASEAIDAAIAGLAVHVALSHLAAGGDAGTLLALELTPDLRCTRHVVYRVPRCPACSSVATRAPLAPWSDVAA